MIHRVSPMRRWLGPAVIFAICLIPMLGVLDDQAAEDALAMGIFFMLFGLILALGMYWLIDRARVITDEEFLELRLPGCSLRTEWTNLVRLDMTPGCQGVFLHSSRGGGLQRVVTSLPTSIRQMPTEQAEALAQGRFVPLTPFMWRWKGPLGAAFRQHAPKLFARQANRVPGK